MCMFRFVVYGSFLIFLGYSYFLVREWYSDPERQRLENVYLDCEPIYNNHSSAKKYVDWKLRTEHVEEELMNSDDICPVLEKYFTFEKHPLSDEEKDFPLAYGLVVYQDIIQLLLELSLFYQPQNEFCITIDAAAWESFARIVMKLPDCFQNIHVFVGRVSRWGSFGIVENMYNCVDFLAKSEKDWKYFQYLSGSDVPLRTNLETVRIMKALNGSINADVEIYNPLRLLNKTEEDSPLKIFKGSMSVALPRAAVNHIVSSQRARSFFKFIEGTGIPDESVWGSLSGNAKDFPVPGSFNADDVLSVRYDPNTTISALQTVDHIGSSFIGRYQLFWEHPACKGVLWNTSCVFGIFDVPNLLTRPEILAHKMSLAFQPAGMMCLIKEYRRKSRNPSKFDAKSYSEMPTVELHSGKSLKELTHPEWLKMSTFSLYFRENAL